VQNIKIKNKYKTLILLLFFTSCSYWSKENNRKILASVEGKKLYKDELPVDIFVGLNKEDSLMQAKNYIENWAYTQLMISEAKKNIDTVRINQLVRQYKTDLLLETYQNKLAGKFLDSTIQPEQWQKAYKENGQIYTAKEALLKADVLIMNKNNKKKALYKKWFYSKKNEEKDSLFKHIAEFKKLNFDEKWTYISKFKEKYPVFKKISDRNIIKKSKKFVLSDSLDLYLIFIKDIVLKEQQLPLEFIKPELKQIILNQRKEKWLARLKNEMMEDALKTKKIKIYKTNK